MGRSRAPAPAHAGLRGCDMHARRAVPAWTLALTLLVSAVHADEATADRPVVRLETLEAGGHPGAVTGRLLEIDPDSYVLSGASPLGITPHVHRLPMAPLGQLGPSGADNDIRLSRLRAWVSSQRSGRARSSSRLLAGVGGPPRRPRWTAWRVQRSEKRPPRSLGPSVRCRGPGLLPRVDGAAARVARARSQVFLDAEELVVLRHAVGPRGRARLDLPGSRWPPRGRRWSRPPSRRCGGSSCRCSPRARPWPRSRGSP